MNKHTVEMLGRLQAAGISTSDALALRRIAMTLHRWYELECGDGNDYASWRITRGNKKRIRADNGVHVSEFEHDDNGAPHLERHAHNENKARYSRIPDRERGAQKRLAKIMAKYPGFASYLQTDPRGAPLYILRPGDVPAFGEERDNLSSYYNRGIAVHK